MQTANLLGTSTQPGYCARGWAWSLSQARANSQSLGHEHPARLLRARADGIGVGSGSACPNSVTPGLRSPRVSVPGVIIVQSFMSSVCVVVDSVAHSRGIWGREGKRDFMVHAKEPAISIT